MNEAMPNFESLLREALAPWSRRRPGGAPGEHAHQHPEMAADELEAWELSSMRDPRNWVRPAAAVVAGASRDRARDPAGAQTSARCCRRLGCAARPAERTVRDISRETRKLLGDL